MRNIFTQLFCLIALLFISASVACAQTQMERNVSVGIRGAANITYITSFEICPYVGWGAGLNVRVPFSDRFSFYGEVNYDRYVVWSGIHQAGSTYFVFDNNNYLSVPLMVQYSFGQRKRDYLSFGPTLRFSMGAESVAYKDFIQRSWREPLDLGNREIYPMVLAINVGYGKLIPVSRRFDFIWECRFSGDITPLYERYHGHKFSHLLNIGFAVSFMYKL